MLNSRRVLLAMFAVTAIAALAVLGLLPGWGYAQQAGEAAPKVPELVPFTKAMADQLADAKVAMDTIWVLVTAFLVFFMNLGFAMVESGLCRSKNTVNILAKNFIVFAISSLAFYVIGWGLMFGDGTPFVGTQGLLLVGGPDNSPATGDAYKGVYSAINWTGVPLWAKFFFQLVFAGTAATIVSGAVAERIKFKGFIVFTFMMVGLIYPVVGHWIWGGGWLAKLGMWDFAGSTVVHSVGGWAALAGALLLGPRIGKYTRAGGVIPIPGHNLTAATIGTFVLWFGWFGFNPGSTMAADWNAIARIAVTTNSAAAAAAFSATLAAWWLLGKPDLTMILNGCLAGLVAITAPCAFVSVGSSVLIGLMAGVLVVLSVLAFDKVKVDDPVGAISVHLVCGAFGTLAVGLFAEDAIMPNTTGNGLFFGGGTNLLLAQATGVLGAGAFAFGVAFLAWAALKGLVGIRVSAEEELEGLDLGEHGITAYPDFQVGMSRGVPATQLGYGTERPRMAAAAKEALAAMAEVVAPPEPALAMATAGPAAPGLRTGRRTPPPPPSAHPAAAAPLPAFRDAPFKVVVEGVDRAALKRLWERLCHDYPHQTPPEFNTLYPHLSLYTGDTFVFRRGEPMRFRDELQELLYRHGLSVSGARVELS